MVGYELPNIKTEPELIIDDANHTSTDATSQCQAVKCLKDIQSDEDINCNIKKFKFKCKSCDKCFDQKATMARHHLIVHTYERDFSCDICKSTFADKECVRNHMQQHIKHYCPICNEPFRHAFNIKRHMLVHNGLRPHRCNVCSRTYKHSSHLKRHLRHHEDGGTYQDTKPLNEEKSNKCKRRKASQNTEDMNLATIPVSKSKTSKKSLRKLVPHNKKNADILDRLTDILR